MIDFAIGLVVGGLVVWIWGSAWLDDWWRKQYDKDFATIAAANRRLLAQLTELQHNEKENG